MFDPKFIREHAKKIKESMEKRQLDATIVDQWLEYDKNFRKLKEKIDNLRHKRNVISEEINRLKKEGKNEEAEKRIAEIRELPRKIKELTAKAEEIEKKALQLIVKIPNLLGKDVPVGKDEKDNKILREYKPKKFSFEPKGHEELGLALDLLDIKRAAKTTGARFYFLKNEAVLLDLALQRFALDFLKKKNYIVVEPPFMLRQEPYQKVVLFETFEEMLYKIENEDLYLIATAEHPLAAYFMNETLEEERLPIKFAGISPCFRKEAGAHGKDTKGIFRVHQFNKVEQFIFCKPQDSEHFHEEMLKNMEQLYKALKIPYRIVLMCSATTGLSAAKQYDIEAWFPAQNCYREVGSCSNCLDYQARSLNIKFINRKNEKQFVHTLNATAIATQRTIAAILENYQQKDGSVLVPKVLQKYCGFKIIKPSKKLKI